MRKAENTHFDRWEMVSSDVFIYIFISIVLSVSLITYQVSICSAWVCMWPILLDPLQVPNLVDVRKVFTKSYSMISPLGRVVNEGKGS